MLSKRQETEARLMWLLERLVEEYHSYNPDGDYLSISYRLDDGEEYLSIYNGAFREESIDRDLKIDVSKIDGEIRSM